jgi:hypothetical protein
MPKGGVIALEGYSCKKRGLTPIFLIYQPDIPTVLNKFCRYYQNTNFKFINLLVVKIGE